jgi:glucose-1-phosphate cytidylyltransferase
MRTLILCGGKGTRAHPHTTELPKPLLEVAGTPILRHVMDIYAAQGFIDFVLAAGFRAEQIEAFAHTLPEKWSVTVVDSGESTGTGGRVAACAELLGDRCFLTYGDGVGDVDLHALLDHHVRCGGAATVTTVPLPSPYGTVETDATGRVVAFQEKPRLADHWINAGFLVLERRALRWCTHDDLERGVLPALGAAGELFAHRHLGFWRSLDTYKDAVELSALVHDGEPPWRVRTEATVAVPS